MIPCRCGRSDGRHPRLHRHGHRRRGRPDRWRDGHGRRRRLIGDRHGRPLRGVRIIELAGIGPGPFAAMMLSDMGAEVIRVERAQAVPASPRAPGVGRPQPRPSQPGPGSQAPRGHRDAADAGREGRRAHRGLRSGVMERLGVGPEVCLARNPRLVFGRMTGWGQDGPYVGRRSRHQLHLAGRRALRTSAATASLRHRR